MTEQTIIVTTAQPLVVTETIDQVKKMLRSAKDDRSKYIHPHLLQGGECIVCTDIIAVVVRQNVQEAKQPTKPEGVIIKPPPGTFK